MARPSSRAVRLSVALLLTSLPLSACGDDAAAPASPVESAGRESPDGDAGVGSVAAPDAAPLAPLDAAREEAAADAREDGALAIDSASADAGPRYDEALFMATHNSYSGQARGAIAEQLDNGVRFLELDLHDDNYATIGDYRIGHDSPGNQLATGAPNPTTTLFRDWLKVIADWSSAHPGHAPIAVGLDLKSDLTNDTSFSLGNLGALNGALQSVLGGALLPARDVPSPWPTVEALRGRVMVVLSGSEPTRRAYRLDSASVASVAMNASGQVVEVHASAHGDLWYWTGAFDAAGAVRWQRHGRFGKGAAPAVALSDTGLLVEAHESGSGALSYRAGVLGSDLEIAWQSELPLGHGTKPSVRATSGGPALRAVWTAPSGGGNMGLDGAFTSGASAVTWNAAGAQSTSDPRFDTARDSRGALWIGVRTGADALAPSDTLLYATATTPTDRVRYDQIAFVEHQKGGDPLLEQEARFHSAAATEKAWLASARASRHVVRGWQFDDVSLATTPFSNFPATDTPNASWYVTYSQQNGAIR